MYCRNSTEEDVHLISHFIEDVEKRVSRKLYANITIIIVFPLFFSICHETKTKNALCLYHLSHLGDSKAYRGQEYLSKAVPNKSL